MKLKSLLVITLFSCSALASAQTLRINGSTTVNPVVVDAAEHFKPQGWRVLVDTNGGSSGGIAHAAEGISDIGMSSKQLTDSDRKRFAEAKLHETVIGYDAVALVISSNLYNAGVQSLTQDQVRQLYEGKIKNWKEVGGPDRRVVFFNKEPGRGTWEVFADFLYGNANLAPKVFHPEVGANQEARTKVAGHHGAITQLSASWAWDRPDIKPLAIKLENDQILQPDLKSIESGAYPLRRPLLLITKGEANGEVREFIDYILSSEGQKLLQKHGYLPVTTVGAS